MKLTETDTHAQREKNGELTRRLISRVLEEFPDVSAEERTKVTHFRKNGDGKFASLVTFRKGVTVTLAIPFQDLNDPLRMCSERKADKTWGVGSVHAEFRDIETLDYATSLIRQGYERHRSEEDSAE